MVKMVAAVTSFICTAFWANAASAFCIFGICMGGGGGVGVRLRPLKSMVQVVLRQSPCSSASEPSPTGHCSDAEAASFVDAVPMSVNRSKLAVGEVPSPSATLRVAGCAILGAIQYAACIASASSFPPLRASRLQNIQLGRAHCLVSALRLYAR